MHMLTDVGQAWRSLRRERGFSLIVVAILSLGIAATVSVYSIVAGVVLRPLPFHSPDELVMIRQVDAREGYEYGVSGPSLRDWEASSRTLASLAATSGPGRAILEDGSGPTRVARTQVTAAFFEVLGTQPVLGRTLMKSDGAEGGQRVAVLSHRLWRERFGGESRVLGRAVSIDGEPHEIVGVAAADLELPRDTEIWTLMPADADFLDVRHAHILGAFARVRGGVTPEAVQTELNAILARVPGYEVTARVIPLKEQLVGDFRSPLLILLAAVGCVLLIACANAGTLLLARSTRRRRELAVRSALGAGTRQLAMQVLSEGLLLGLLAGVLGVVLAAWLLDALIALAPGDLPRAHEIGIDAGVLGFALTASVATGLLAGILPTLRTRRVDAGSVLKETDLRAGGRLGGLRSTFVVAEVALSVMLLVGAGLLLRSFVRITSIDPGFRAELVTTFEVSLPSYRYQDDARIHRYNDALLEGVRALPQVAGAAIAQNLPVSGVDMVTPAVLEERAVENPPRVQISAVSDAYFETMGIRVVEGRSFRASDGASATPVAMVNEAFVRAYYDGESPLGRRAHTYFGEQVMREIVGVVATTAHGSLIEPPEPVFYYPAAQMPPASWRLVVRSEAPAASLLPAVRAVAARIDPEVPLGEVATMQELLGRTTAQPRYYATALGLFAALALLLALSGFFAVLSQAVARRQREMGIRLALGAAPHRILQLVVREGMTLTVIGLAIGIAGALAAGRVLRGLLFGVGPADPLVLAGVTLTLLVVALGAAWWPARRAAAVDPVRSLAAD